MRNTFSNCGPRLTNEDIENFEKRHDFLLPSDYRSFLKQFNGGMPSMKVLDLPGGQSVAVWVLYSLNDRSHFDLERTCSSLDWEEAHDLGYLRIGRDPGGSAIFIATKGSDAGAIFFLDREETLRPSSGIVRIAGSFDEMMNNLRPL